MAQTAQAVYSLVQHVSNEQAVWKPGLESWSILEVIHHLYDEEREDFRTRLDFTLHRAGKPWPNIDPQGWVLARAYNQQDFQATLAGFRQEREISLRWLAELKTPNWDLAYEAPFGLITAGDLLAAWAAHDLLHTRQLVELHWAYTTQSMLPYRVEYAGVW
jgi:hypothetical protein